MNANVYYEHGVSDSHVDAAVLATQTMGNLVNRSTAINVRCLDIELPELQTGQVDSTFIDKVHVDESTSALFVMSRDLGVVGLNFVFGSSAFNRRVAIVSSSRVDETSMFGLVLHESGHMEGVVDEISPQYDRVSQFAGHCANDCVMQPVNNINDMKATAEKVMSCPHSAGFCNMCTADLISAQSK